jgi:ABC-type nickel/cobalt efflux system permease component RcnA
MKKIYRLPIVLLTVLFLLSIAQVVFAHPLGNFTINQFVGLEVGREKINIEYILDMAEIPAFQEIAAFDANGNDQPDSIEMVGYPPDKCAALRPDLELRTNNRELDVFLTSSSVEFPPGSGGLPTLRLTCQFQAHLDEFQGDTNISFSNNAFPQRLGWREIVVHSDGVSLYGDFATSSLSQRLTSYPQDLLSSPLDQRQVKFEIQAGETSAQRAAPRVTEPIPSQTTDRSDAFTRLVLLEEINLQTILAALAISFVWGAMHALTPGHGKTIVGAYLVGSRGTIKHALYLGLTTTVTHTAGVFVLGMVTLFAARFILPETLYPWLSLLSGLFVAAIGLNLSVARFKSSGLITGLLKMRPGNSSSSRMKISIRPAPQQTPVGIGAFHHGHHIQPSPGQHHSHLHEQHHHTHVHGHAHPSHHGDADHSHLPPGADGSPVTWRNLLALGVSGGLLPCPSALVVLLGAIALDRIGFGMLLVLAFSLGLAGVLTAMGVMFVYAGRFFERVPASGKITRILPVLSAFFISLLGVGIITRALAEIGLIGRSSL